MDSMETTRLRSRPHQIRLLNLPDDMLRVISEYCDLTTRCAVTCANSAALTSVLLGKVTLSKEGSERFLKDNQFRSRISRRVVTPDRNLHLQVKIKENVFDPRIKILNSVRSVLLYTEIGEWNSAWVNQLSRIQTVTKLNLIGANISDVSAFAGLRNLILLNLCSTQLSDVSALAGLTTLTYLDLSFTEVPDVSALAGLTNLTDLNLRGTQVSDVSALAGLTSLTYLNLSCAKVSDLSALAGLTNLTHLYLIDTQVSDVSTLAGLTNLTQLSLWSTEVSDVSALAGLAKLRISR